MKHAPGKKINVEYSGDDIGINLVESITSGLYTDIRHVIREYVQNAIDAKAKNIRINLEEDTLIIEDDGTGMDKSEVQWAIKIGRSRKNIGESVGFRGIGIWAGTTIAKKITIDTSCEGNNKKYRINFNASAIRKEYGTGKSAPPVLSKYVSISEFPEKKSKRYTVVRIEKIIPEALKIIKDTGGLTAYLGYNLPVDFNPSFIYRKQLTKEIDQNTNFKKVSIKLNGTPIFKPFSNEVGLPEIRKITNSEGKEIGFCWGCIHSERGGFKDKYIRGLTYRWKGFAVGDYKTSEEVFSSGSAFLFSWWTGEIHIISSTIKPDSGRSRFEVSTEWDEFLLRTQKILKQYEDIARQKSARENADKNIKRSSEEAENCVEALDSCRGPEKVVRIVKMKEIRKKVKQRMNKASPKYKKQAENILSLVDKTLKKHETPEILKKAKKIKKLALNEDISLSDLLEHKKVPDIVKDLLNIINDVLKKHLGKSSSVYKAIIGNVVCEVNKKYKYIK